ncbi:hypothetical protein Scel_02310 [Streptomyces cellostaticus]|nr:hypothetical protein Scel_02310 [Streptomyces cellostaticus]
MTDIPESNGAALRYPLTPPTALEPPAEWARLRRQCPVARVTPCRAGTRRGC